MKPKATYDPEADAIGISFKPNGVEYVESAEVAPGMTLDYGADGRVIGVEILGVRRFLAEGVLAAPEEPSPAMDPAAAE
jgi:uncharacterized protein YuzE